MKRPILVEKNDVVSKRKKYRRKVKIASDIETSEDENIEIICSSESDISDLEEENFDTEDLPIVNEKFRKLDRKPKCKDYVLVSFNVKKKKYIMLL